MHGLVLLKRSLALIALVSIPAVFPLPALSQCTSPTVDNSFCVEGSSVEGTLTRASYIWARDGGAAALIGPWMFWTFGDTFTYSTNPPADGQVRSYTAMLSTPNVPNYLNLVHQTDANGAPLQFMPYTQSEIDFNFCASATVANRPSWCNTVSPYPPKMKCDPNPGGVCTDNAQKKCTADTQCAPKCVPIVNRCSDNTNVSCTYDSQCGKRCDLTRRQCIEDSKQTCRVGVDTDCKQRMVVWPTRAIEISSSGCANRSSPTCQGTGVVFYSKLRTKCVEYCYDWIENGFALVTLKANEIRTTANANTRQSLFKASLNEKSWLPAIEWGGEIYLRSGGYFAKVPKAQYGSKGSYKYWNSNANRWETSASLATQDPNYIGGETIAWNPYLRRFISFQFAGANGFTTLLRDIYVQSAKNIQGPWSPGVKAFSTSGSTGENNYYAEGHPELDTLYGRETRVSWVRNNSDPSQDVRVNKVTLKSLEDNSDCLTYSYPTAVAKGQKFYVVANIKNNGTRPWLSSEYNLVEGSFSGATTYWNIGSVSLPSSTVNPGSTATFGFYATAPSSFASGSNVYMRFRVRHTPANVYFGETCLLTIKVN